MTDTFYIVSAKSKVLHIRVQQGGKMIERFLEIRNKLSLNIWFITDLPKKTVEQILDIALFTIIGVVVLMVVAVCLFVKYRREKNKEVASLKNQIAKERAKREADEDVEDDEDGQMVEIFVKGRDGTRKEKVPTKYVNFKGR
jgi:hypothetical protein